MKKTGILTFHRAINYGAVLQSYALQQTVASLGADCEIVDYICPRIVSDYKPFRIGKKNPLADFVKSCIMFRRRAKRAKAFQSFFNNCLVKSARSYTPETLTEAKKDYDVLITGSDQVWSPNCVGFDPAYFLTFADSRQKYSYAASFAVTELPKDRVDEYKSRLKDFQAYSVREKSGEKLVKQLTGKSACTHPDPTLLLGKEAWSKIGVRKCDKPYILIFTANPPVELVDCACRLAKEKNLPVYRLVDAPQRGHSEVKNIKATSVEEFVGWFMHADYVFTNSFHGTAFSVIFNKSLFVEFKNKKGRNIRSEELLDSLGISRDLDKTGLEETEIDWNRVNGELESKKQAAIEYLKSVVN